ncbi:MAG: hypothetical protein WAZ14_01865 [Patescibacteria group bacterium]
MLSLHNKFMRGTKLDVGVGLLLTAFVGLIAVMIVGPARQLAAERDAVRTEDVRGLMTKILQLELVDPEAYTRLEAAVQQAGDLRTVIGYGDCAGSFGRECADAVTSDSCLSLAEFFPDLLLASVPVDPAEGRYSAERTGYYLVTVAGELEVGACGAAKGPITLRKAFE